MKYVKKPVIIEAMIWTGDNESDILEFMNWRHADIGKEYGLRIHTLEGLMQANIGDYIIKGVSGEFYPCKPEIFKLTYDKV